MDFITIRYRQVICARNVQVTLNKNALTHHERAFINLLGDLTGARTQDPLLKREMLYQLSYQISTYFL